MVNTEQDVANRINMRPTIFGAKEGSRFQTGEDAYYQLAADIANHFPTVRIAERTPIIFIPSKHRAERSLYAAYLSQLRGGSHVRYLFHLPSLQNALGDLEKHQRREARLYLRAFPRNPNIELAYTNSEFTEMIIGEDPSNNRNYAAFPIDNPEGKRVAAILIRTDESLIRWFDKEFFSKGEMTGKNFSYSLVKS